MTIVRNKPKKKEMNVIQEFYCLIHQDSRIDYLQVYGFSSNKNNNQMFYCLECVENDINFKPTNYLLFQKLIKSELKQINLKWPPLPNCNILNQLNETFNDNKNDNNNNNCMSHIQQIEIFFSNLKKQIMEQIDKCQKQMIEKALLSENNKEKILQKYQEISKLNELKSIFENKNTSINEKQKQYKDLLDNIKVQSSSIIQQLSKLQESISVKFQTEAAQNMSSIILDCIQNINFFEQKPFEDLKPNNNVNTLISSFIMTYKNLGWSLYFDNQKIFKDKNDEILLQKNFPFDESTQFISDYIINPSKKHVFRVQLLPVNNNDYCRAYLSFIEHEYAPTQRYSFLQLKYLNRQIGIDYQSDQGDCSEFIQKKGQGFQLSSENILEIRICLNEEVYEFLDYPNYNYHLSINQYAKRYLSESNQRLGFTIPQSSQIKFLRNNAFIVDKF